MKKATSHTPKVSIVSISYNQEKYIAQTLEGFVMQKTDFDFEIVIGDDCSTDKTAEIIEEYAKKYPDIFKPILRKKNIGVQPNLIDVMQKARGQYIALCEGDDYWTDPQKIQLQADFLDAEQKYSMCFHPVKVFFENDNRKSFIYPEPQDKPKFVVAELLQYNFMQTNSVMYRRRTYNDVPDNIMPLDWYLHLFHAQFGKIGFIDKTMAAYRRHAGGIWWANEGKHDEIWRKYGLSHMVTYDALLKIYGNDEEYKKIIYETIYNAFEKIAEVDDKVLEQVIEKFPAYAKYFLQRIRKNITEQIQELAKSQEEIIRITSQKEQLEQENSLLKAKKLVRLEDALKRRVKRKIT